MSDSKVHDHKHIDEEMSSGKLLFTVILNFTITAAQIIGGIISNSLALLSDALHNLSDGVAVVIAYFASKLSKKESSAEKTFGYKRAEILAALFNSVVLIAVSIYLFYEAVKHFMEPEPINGMIMFVVAVIGLLANLVSVIILKKDSGRNINIKAAYLHLLGDTLSSVGVIAGGILIIFYKIYWVDPLLTFIIGLYILKETFVILKEAVEILMQAAPAGISINDIKDELEKMQEIDNIHHVHIWNLSDRDIHFECHVDLCRDMPVGDTSDIRERIEEILSRKFEINHITVQFEHNDCHNKELISSEGNHNGHNN